MRKGVKMAELTYPKEIEVERVMNLAGSWGWEKVKEEQIDEELHLTIKKKFPVEIEKVSERPEG